MNHVLEIRDLSNVLYGLVQEYMREIEQIKNPKHHVEMTQELDKLCNYAGKMMTYFDEMNRWFSAFGSPEEKQ